MKFILDKRRPICPQMCEYLCATIANGDIKPGDKLLSVREVAVNAGVNPNTVQKTYEQLEQKGVIYSVRGTGWFVCEDISPAIETTKNMAKSKTEQYIAEMQTLGFEPEEIKTYLEEWFK